MRLQQYLILLLTTIGLSTYALAESDVTIDVTLSPAGTFKAQTKEVKGHAVKTKDGVTAEGIVIELKTLSTGISLRDKHLKERLLVNKFPQAKLINATGKDGKGKATIEVKGQKKEVTGTYKISGNELVADFKVHLPDLQINDVRYMGVGVKDDVIVHITLPIKAAAARSAASTKKK